jgi:hypothetical protein
VCPGSGGGAEWRGGVSRVNGGICALVKVREIFSNNIYRTNYHFTNKRTNNTTVAL